MFHASPRTSAALQSHQHQATWNTENLARFRWTEVVVPLRSSTGWWSLIRERLRPVYKFIAFVFCVEKGGGNSSLVVQFVGFTSTKREPLNIGREENVFAANRNGYKFNNRLSASWFRLLQCLWTARPTYTRIRFVPSFLFIPPSFLNCSPPSRDTRFISFLFFRPRSIYAAFLIRKFAKRILFSSRPFFKSSRIFKCGTVFSEETNIILNGEYFQNSKS